MKCLVLVLMLGLCPGAAGAQDLELPPFPRALHLDPDVSLGLSESRGVQYLKAPVAYVSTLRARTEWSREHWLIEKRLRLSVTDSLERTHEKVSLAVKAGYEGRLTLMRGYLTGLEDAAKEDQVTINALRNPPVYKTRGFAYGAGILTAVALGVAGALASK